MKSPASSFPRQTLKELEAPELQQETEASR